MSHIDYPSRKAILIGSPGPLNNYLNGVDSDIKNLVDFLSSDKGGRWDTDEISILSNPTQKNVLNTIHNSVADYVFVYFSGHGFTTSDNERMLSLKDHAINDLFLLNKSPRQLIVVDACRNYTEPGITGIPDFGEEWYSFDGEYESRKIFDNAIINSPKGKIIVHGTKNGEYSYDSSNGGYFTQALLNISSRIITKDTYIPVDIVKIIPYLPNVLKKQQIPQIPSITYNEGNLKVPFAIGIPDSKLPFQSKKKSSKPVVSNNNYVGLGIVLLLLGIAAYSE